MYHGNAGAVVEFEVWDGGVDVGHVGWSLGRFIWFGVRGGARKTNWS